MGSEQTHGVELVLPAVSKRAVRNCSSIQPLLSSVYGTCRAGGGFPKDWSAGTSPMHLGSTDVCPGVSELPVTLAANVSCFAVTLEHQCWALAVGLLAGCFAGGCGSEGQLELPAPAFGVTAPPALQ